MRVSVQHFANDEIAQSARASLMTAQMELQRDAATLSRKAELLATLMAMTPARFFATSTLT